MAGIFVRKDLPYFLFIMKNKKRMCVLFLQDFILKTIVRADLLKEKMFINENNGTGKTETNGRVGIVIWREGRKIWIFSINRFLIKSLE